MNRRTRLDPKGSGRVLFARSSRTSAKYFLRGNSLLLSVERLPIRPTHWPSRVPRYRSFASSMLEPMYATVGTALPAADEWTFEPKYDGMRVLAFVTSPGGPARLVTRNGADKTRQFPEVAKALTTLARRASPLVLDGEIVALRRNVPGEFQALQGRVHVQDVNEVNRKARESPAALVVFDLLLVEDETLLQSPWTIRRQRLERVMRLPLPSALRVSESSSNGKRMIARARERGWEGVIGKRTTSQYVPGARSRDWIKLKLQYRAEFVVGGFTDPRRSREHLGALLLGYFDGSGRLCYVGNAGGGFDRRSLKDMWSRLAPLERKSSRFAVAPHTTEPVHWVAPKVVVEVKFAEWTADGKLRQPIFLGVREDKNARDVGLEKRSVQQWSGGVGDRVVAPHPKEAASAARSRRARTPAKSSGGVPPVVEQLDRIANDGGGDGVIEFGRGRELRVSHLGKVYFTKAGVTKGDLMRYYAEVSPVLLPAIKDRPLILKRYPDGIDGPSFFQQNAGEHTPPGVRVEDTGAEGQDASRIIGGDLLTLLYTVQIGTIAVHPWQSRLGTIDSADYSTIDLDPGEGVPFSKVIELAGYLKKELDQWGLRAALKTSGSRGLHIVMPMPRNSPYSRSAALAERIGTRVAEAYPTLATLERRLAKRPRGTIYVDAQQNARGKSVASAYSVRERPGAPVSAPLSWTELRPGLKLESFTILTMGDRVARLGDLWGESLTARNTARIIERVLRGSS